MSDITRSEAIAILKDIISRPNLYSNFIIDACKFALASLETDEAYQLEYARTTKNDLAVDCISRKALLDATVKKNSIWNHITNSEDDNLEAIISKLPSVTPQEPFINKPCVSGGVCEHDKQKVLEKIRAEIEAKCCITVGRENDGAITLHDVFEIIDKYKTESEE